MRVAPAKFASNAASTKVASKLLTFSCFLLLRFIFFVVAAIMASIAASSSTVSVLAWRMEKILLRYGLR